MQKRSHLISFVNTSGHTCFIKSVGRTGSVTVTTDRAKARLFTPLGAIAQAEKITFLMYSGCKVEAA